MAGVLRELIARVVLRVDDSTLKRLDTQLNSVKQHIAQTQAQAQQGVAVNVAVNATEAEKSLAGIRVALAEMGTAVETAVLANLQEQFGTASGAADKLRLDIDRLKAADPSNPRIAELTRQLNAVESEVKQTATALDKAKSSIDGVKSSSGQASGMLGQFRNALGGLGIALGAAGLIGFVHQTLEAAGAVEDLSDRLGMGIEEVQVWSAFAKQAGADSEALTASTKGLANAMQGAANGGKEQKAAFEALGISTDNWKKGLPPLTETLALVGGKLGEVDNEGQRLALTQKLLSEGGLKLAPAFKGGTAAVQEQLENLKELSVVYSEDFVKSAGAAGDELDLFYGQFRGLGSELILMFLPALRGAVRELTPIIRGFREAFTSSRIFTGGLVAAGAAGLSSFGGLSGLFARFGPTLARIGALVLPFIKGFLKFAAIALIVDDFFVMLNGGKSVLGEVLGKFELGRTILETFRMGFMLLKGTVLSVWGALSGDKDAIAKGASLLDQFSGWITKFVGNVKFMFTDLFSRVIPGVIADGWNSLDESTRETLEGIWKFIAQWAADIAGVLGGIWDGALDGLKSLLKGAGKLLSNIPGLEGLDPDNPGDSGAPKPAPENGLDAGAPTAPALPAPVGGSVTVNNNQTFSTSIGAGAPKEVVKAVQSTEKAYSNHITKDSRQTLRAVVGATR